MQSVFDIATCQTLDYGEYISTETRHLEFKQGQGKSLIKKFPELVFRYGSAFLNVEGGTLLFGVMDEGHVCGTNLDESMEKEIRHSMDESAHLFEPPLTSDRYTLRFIPVTLPAGQPQEEDLKVIYVHFTAPQASSVIIYRVNEGEVHLRRDASVWGPLDECDIQELQRQKDAFSAHQNERRDVLTHLDGLVCRRQSTGPAESTEGLAFFQITITGLGVMPRRNGRGREESEDGRAARGFQIRRRRSRSPLHRCPQRRTINIQDIVSGHSMLYESYIDNDTENIKFMSGDNNYLFMNFRDDILDYGCNFMSKQGGTLLVGVSHIGMVCGLDVNHKEEDDIRLMVDRAIGRIKPALFPQNYTLQFLPVEMPQHREGNWKVISLHFRMPPASPKRVTYQAIPFKP